jgi:hypothetical protein
MSTIRRTEKKSHSESNSTRMDTLDLIYEVFSEIEDARSQNNNELVQTLEEKLDHLRNELGIRYRNRGNIHSFADFKKS